MPTSPPPRRRRELQGASCPVHSDSATASAIGGSSDTSESWVAHPVCLALDAPDTCQRLKDQWARREACGLVSMAPQLGVLAGTGSQAVGRGGGRRPGRKGGRAEEEVA